MEIGKALMVSDILIVLAAAVRFGMGTGLYCIPGLIGKSLWVDGAIENIRLRKVCTIMTANPQPIPGLHHPRYEPLATVEKAYGACHTPPRAQRAGDRAYPPSGFAAAQLPAENDPHSFITIVNSSEIIGKGFRPSTKTASYPFFSSIFPIKASPTGEAFIQRIAPVFRATPYLKKKRKIVYYIVL